jgi:site-specific DNA recombinase
MDGFVVDRVRAAGRDPTLLREVLAQAGRQQEERAAGLTAEEKGLVAEVAGLRRELAAESARFRPGADNADLIRRLAGLHDGVRLAEDRLARVREDQRAVAAADISPANAGAALAGFDPVWAGLAAAERARVVALLVEKVVYDGASGKVAVTFRPTGLTALAAELADRQREAVA